VSDRYRTGRRQGRNIYDTTRTDPTTGDHLQVGCMDTHRLGADVVAALNATLPRAADGPHTELLDRLAGEVEQAHEDGRSSVCVDLPTADDLLAALHQLRRLRDLADDDDAAGDVLALEAALAEARDERDENERVFIVWRRRCEEADRVLVEARRLAQQALVVDGMQVAPSSLVQLVDLLTKAPSLDVTRWEKDEADG
jgi:hypothetical protein